MIDRLHFASYNENSALIGCGIFLRAEEIYNFWLEDAFFRLSCITLLAILDSRMHFFSLRGHCNGKMRHQNWFLIIGDAWLASSFLFFGNFSAVWKKLHLTLQIFPISLLAGTVRPGKRKKKVGAARVSRCLSLRLKSMDMPLRLK